MRKVLLMAMMALVLAGCSKDDGNDDVVNKIDLAHYKQLLVGTWQTNEEHIGVWGKTISFSSDGMMNDSVPYKLSVMQTVGEMAGGHGNYYEYQYCALQIGNEGNHYQVSERDADHITFERMTGYSVKYNYERTK